MGFAWITAQLSYTAHNVTSTAQTSAQPSVLNQRSGAHPLGTQVTKIQVKV